MGRTLPTFTNLVDAERARRAPFRRQLTPEEREAYDVLWGAPFPRRAGELPIVGLPVRDDDPDDASGPVEEPPCAQGENGVRSTER